ncbi:MAG: 6-phosphogluconolactonase [Phycisphaerales bacterium]|nr:6-phosphogluconolactonase [Phycisphaerales bacterium]
MPEHELYQLAPRPPTPKLPGVVVVRESADEIIDALAAEMLIHAHNCVRAYGEFHMALSGGSTPVPLYERLMIDPALRGFPWERSHVWIVDERRVPFDDDRSNFKAINEILGDHSGLPSGHIHPIFAMADDADTAYELQLRRVLGKRERGQERLDFVLLGMGADGHTASLFARSPALSGGGNPPRLVRINAGPAVTPPDRVTLTFDMINASRFVALLVTGQSKRATLAKVAAISPVAAGPGPGGAAGGPPASGEQISELPVLGVRPVAGVLRWYLDSCACPMDGA